MNANTMERLAGMQDGAYKETWLDAWNYAKRAKN
jgi:hypothetical protein